MNYPNKYFNMSDVFDVMFPVIYFLKPSASLKNQV